MFWTFNGLEHLVPQIPPSLIDSIFECKDWSNWKLGEASLSSQDYALPPNHANIKPLSTEATAGLLRLAEEFGQNKEDVFCSLAVWAIVAVYAKSGLPIEMEPKPKISKVVATFAEFVSTEGGSFCKDNKLKLQAVSGFPLLGIPEDELESVAITIELLLANLGLHFGLDFSSWVLPVSCTCDVATISTTSTPCTCKAVVLWYTKAFATLSRGNLFDLIKNKSPLPVELRQKVFEACRGFANASIFSEKVASTTAVVNALALKEVLNGNGDASQVSQVLEAFKKLDTSSRLPSILLLAYSLALGDLPGSVPLLWNVEKADAAVLPQAKALLPQWIAHLQERVKLLTPSSPQLPQPGSNGALYTTSSSQIDEIVKQLRNGLFENNFVTWARLLDQATEMNGLQVKKSLVSSLLHNTSASSADISQVSTWNLIGALVGIKPAGAPEVLKNDPKFSSALTVAANSFCNPVLIPDVIINPNSYSLFMWLKLLLNFVFPFQNLGNYLSFEKLLSSRSNHLKALGSFGTTLEFICLSTLGSNHPQRRHFLAWMCTSLAYTRKEVGVMGSNWATDDYQVVSFDKDLVQALPEVSNFSPLLKGQQFVFYSLKGVQKALHALNGGYLDKFGSNFKSFCDNHNVGIMQVPPPLSSPADDNNILEASSRSVKNALFSGSDLIAAPDQLTHKVLMADAGNKQIMSQTSSSFFFTLAPVGNTIASVNAIGSKEDKSKTRAVAENDFQEYLKWKNNNKNNPSNKPPQSNHNPQHKHNAGGGVTRKGGNSQPPAQKKQKGNDGKWSGKKQNNNNGNNNNNNNNNASSSNDNSN